MRRRMRMKKGIITLLAFLTMIIGCSMTVFASPVTMPDGGVFDPEYYALHNPDVVLTVGIDDNALYQHYKNFGIKEGRLGIDPTVQETEAQQLRARVDYVANSTIMDSYTDNEVDTFTIGELVKIPKNYSRLKLKYLEGGEWYAAETRCSRWNEGDADSVIHLYIMNFIEYATKANAMYCTGIDIENAKVSVIKSGIGLRGLDFSWWSGLFNGVHEPALFHSWISCGEVYVSATYIEKLPVVIYPVRDYNGKKVINNGNYDAVRYADFLKLMQEGKVVRTNQYGCITYSGWGSHGGIEYSAPRADGPLYYVYVQ